jgi:hypothetical protein
LKVRKFLALRIAKRIFSSILNTSHIGLTKLISLVYKSEKGPLELEKLVAA